MKRQPRILFCTEASFLKSGYAIYAQKLIKSFFESGKYIVAEFASYSDISTASHHDIPWPFYPNAVGKEDERYDKYKSVYSNQFGHWRFDVVCLDFKPDIVIDFRDPWMFEHEAFSSLRRYFKWIIMPPVDSIPQKNDWIRTFCGADLVIPYTKWAKTEFEKYNINLHPEPALAGVEFDVFKPLDSAEIRNRFGINDDTFIIGSVMRNQKRKMIPELLQSLSSMLKTNNNIKLYLHTTFPEAGGWDIPELLMRYDVISHVLFTYFCRKCHGYHPSTYKGAQIICPHCNSFSSSLSHPNSGVNEQQMAEIYNTFDIYVQYAICEGFGMPQVEAASCGIPIFGINYSAMSEVIEGIGGHKIEPLSLMCEIESGANRASHNNDELIQLVLNYKNSVDKEEKNKIKQQTRINAIVLYNWQNVSRIWMEAIDNIADSIDSNAWENRDIYEISESIDIDIHKPTYELASDIVHNIIKEPELFNSNFVRKIMKDAELGFVINAQDVIPFNKKDMVKKLEQYCNNKKLMDNLRLNGNLQEDYILFARKSL